VCPLVFSAIRNPSIIDLPLYRIKTHLKMIL
jgi:hypothetical protein